MEIPFGNFVWKFRLEISFVNFVWNSCLEILFGNFVWEFHLENLFGRQLKNLFENLFGFFVWKFCLETLFGNFVWKICLEDRPTDRQTERLLEAPSRSLKIPHRNRSQVQVSLKMTAQIDHLNITVTL